MGFFDRLKEGLAKTRDHLASGFESVFGESAQVDDDFFDDLEEVLIMADVGARASDRIIEKLRDKVYDEHITSRSGAKQALVETLAETLKAGEHGGAGVSADGSGETAYGGAGEHGGADSGTADNSGGRRILLVIGVNGVGKTTSIGKLAMKYQAEGRKVILAAADTFRAGAREQLQVWADRVGCEMIGHPDGADPAAVVYDAVSAFEGKKADVLICDTAGRLHNKKNLMDELARINRIFDKKLPDVPKEVLLVLDATTGQNAISQVREFTQFSEPTGIILTKMDGSARGGIVIAIAEEFDIPVRYIGVGERADDLQEFDPEAFLKAIID